MTCWVSSASPWESKEILAVLLCRKHLGLHPADELSCTSDVQGLPKTFSALFEHLCTDIQHRSNDWHGGIHAKDNLRCDSGCSCSNRAACVPAGHLLAFCSFQLYHFLSFIVLFLLLSTLKNVQAEVGGDVQTLRVGKEWIITFFLLFFFSCFSIISLVSKEESQTT